MAKYRNEAKETIQFLREQSVKTWFDLGIFLDRFKEDKPEPSCVFEGSYEDFVPHMEQGGLAFITFLYSIDGVTIEVDKYAKIFKQRMPSLSIHYLAGKIYPESRKIIHPEASCCEIPEAAGFDAWGLYKDFFFTRLERGSETYNKLILNFWEETIRIASKLAQYIEENKITLLFPINVCSNPGNVSLALALVLVSELMGIPVINNNHDFYWEGGNRRIDIQEKGLKKGPRDFFFTNAHLGEVFSVIEMIFPWDSRIWMNVNINSEQSRHLIEVNGHNPANVTEIGTAVDTSIYHNISKRQKINAYHQFEQILSRYQSGLVSYSISDALKNKLVNKNDPRPILIGSKTQTVSKFLNENIIFLQPTRIIGRKRIERGFDLISKLMEDPDFSDRIRNTPNLKLTILVTGPIAMGQHDYFKKLLKRFSKLLNSFGQGIKEKLFLAFLFAELDKESFKKRFDEPVGIPELYNIASLVLLPSKTEGRGLPIIEAAACGTPIFCSRYQPENVYAEVIGEHLTEKSRLKVIELKGSKISSKHAKMIIERVLFPHLFTDEILHNKSAVQKRFSLQALTKNIRRICKDLHHQLQPNEASMEVTQALMSWYKSMVNFRNDDLNSILKDQSRHYLPGYGRLLFMVYLKSLIDPSAFRVEHQEARGFIFGFANHLVNQYGSNKKIPKSVKLDFYNSVDNIFLFHQGEVAVRHDHSFPYRHRNKYHYPYQQYTVQELTGLVNMMFQEIIVPRVKKEIDEPSYFFTDLDLALAQMTSSTSLGIDHRKRLIKKLQQNLPFGLFPGDYTKYELEFFVLQAIRSRLHLTLEQTLTQEHLEANAKTLEPVFVFANERSIGRWFNKEEIADYISQGTEPELKLLYEFGILKLVNSKQVCVGLHFPQMGEEALSALRQIHEKRGFIITNRTHAAVMTDLLDIDRFHIGKVKNEITSNIMGLPMYSGYVQFVPAAVRTSMAYPSPIQTDYSFSEAMDSSLYKELAAEMGEDVLLDKMREDALTKATPITEFLEGLKYKANEDKEVSYQHINGVYDDGMPWNGVIAMARMSRKEINWDFKALTSNGSVKRVTDFCHSFEQESKKKALLAWNGGYILNPELVGKLGLPESYIGSPLGLLLTDNKLVCPPLFNKAALLIDNSGKLSIEKVNCSKGIDIRFKESKLKFGADTYNSQEMVNGLAFYDLMYPKKKVTAAGNYLVRIAGNVVKEIVTPGLNGDIEIIPVGLTLLISPEKFPPEMKEGSELDITVHGLENIHHAIEAGPLLIEDGKIAIDMEDEGWKTDNSIRTQAARLDFTDMRGPKIAVGIDAIGELHVLVINGRIRESVGATHYDMAGILKGLDMQMAMGFDPGGSSTLVVDGKVLNISPYNSEYERNRFALPPEPRAVSNAVVCYIK